MDFPFDRIDNDYDTVTLSSKQALLNRFQKYGFLWMAAASSNQTPTTKILPLLRKIHKENPQFLTRKWSVENTGNCNNESELLDPDSVLKEENGAVTATRRFYVSTILSRHKDGECLQTLLKDTLIQQHSSSQQGDKNDVSSNDATTATSGVSTTSNNNTNNTHDPTRPHLLQDCAHTGGAWLFLGQNNNGDDASCSNSSTKVAHNNNHKKKSKLMVGPLMGRAEHVDEVCHSGTWHVQLSGTKTWYLRPNPSTWMSSSSDVPDLDSFSNYKMGPHVQIIQSKSGGGPIRLCCHVQEGDLFILDTKAWYHRTEIPVTSSLSADVNSNKWSISIARDFNLPPPKCPRQVIEGQVIYEEEEIPHHLSTSNNNDEAPNCAMVEISEEVDDNDTTSIVVIALRMIGKGEPLRLQTNDIDEESGDEEECNAPESIDPRLVAKKNWNCGETVLSGHEIPEDIPLSHDANCCLSVDATMTLQSIRFIEQGDIFTIAPTEDNDLSDYEEVEVELSNGELKRKSV